MRERYNARLRADPTDDFSKAKRDAQEMKSKERKAKLQRDKEKYQKKVKKEYWPKVSVKKQLELEALKEKAKGNVRRSVDRASVDSSGVQKKNKVGQYERPWRGAISDRQVTETQSNGKPIDIKSPSSVKEKAKPRRQRQSSLTTSKNGPIPRDDSSQGLLSKPTRHRAADTGLASHQVVRSMGGDSLPPRSMPSLARKGTTLDVKSDYLAEMRQKRLVREKEGGEYNSEQVGSKIDRLMRDENLNDYERVEIAKRQVAQIEKRARNQEKMLKVANVAGQRDQRDNVQRIINVNDTYIEAITAKLKILDQI
jgi:hypothetical protein